MKKCESKGSILHFCLYIFFLIKVKMFFFFLMNDDFIKTTKGLQKGQDKTCSNRLHTSHPQKHLKHPQVDY